MSMHVVRLGEVCEVNPRMPKSLQDDLAVSFLPMAAVSEDGHIDFEEQRELHEVKKGYTYFERGDVLVAKITPCFENGKATRTRTLYEPIGFGSTEFHVLRAGNEVDASYLFHLIWNSRFREIGAINMTGSAGQKRVPADFLKRLEIPLPSLDEQRRIATILDKADALRRKRKRALELLDGLTQSIFLEMFGSIDNLQGRSDILRLADVVADQRIGLVRSASELSRDLPGTPYLRMDAIGADGKLNLSGIKFTKASAAEVENYSLKKGDFLFNTRNSRELVGKTAVFYGDEETIYNNNILRIRFNGTVTPEYMLAYFRTKAGNRELESRKAGTTSVFAIYQKNLIDLPVVVPPIDAQREFSRKILRLADQALNFKQQSDSLDTLFSSLQHRAFTGQL